MEETQNHEDQYLALFQQASDFIILVDFTGNIVDVNASLCHVFGYTKKELLQMHVSSLIEPENYKASPIKFSLLEQGVHIFSERKMVLKDGTIIEVEANVKKFTATTIMAIVRDVTEKNKAKVQLQRAYERLNYHLNNTPLAVIEEDRNFHITYWNKQAEQIFGWKSEEVLGKRVVDFMIYNEDQAQINQMIEDLGKGISLKQPNENRNYTKDGKVLFCQWYHSLLRNEQGDVETVLSIVRDITDVRTKEETLQRYLILLQELSFVTSHELRSEYAKVQSVLNYLESAAQDGSKPIEAKDHAFLLREATQSFHKINDVIGKLNAKIASGQDLISD